MQDLYIRCCCEHVSTANLPFPLARHFCGHPYLGLSLAYSTLALLVLWTVIGLRGLLQSVRAVSGVHAYCR